MSSETYLSAGVDTEALAQIKEKIAAFSRITHLPGVISSPDSFAGMYRLEGYKEPVLVSSTDGVGTKLKIGALLGHYESLGIDLVNLNVNDILTREPGPFSLWTIFPWATSRPRERRLCCVAWLGRVGKPAAS